jgi:hypothetical protein
MYELAFAFKNGQRPLRREGGGSTDNYNPGRSIGYYFRYLKNFGTHTVIEGFLYTLRTEVIIRGYREVNKMLLPQSS